MNKNKKDYLIYTIGLQIVVCVLLFGIVFGLKTTNSNVYKTIKEEYFDNVGYNVTLGDYKPSGTTAPVTTEPASVEAVTAQATEVITTTTEPSTELAAQVVAQGGADYGVNDENDVPDNVSVKGYTLTKQMVLPLDGSVTSDFGLRTHPISGEPRFHAGIDIAAATGTPIYAAFDGTVIVADYDQWNGNHIKIQHENKIMTVYCHCDSLNVSKGETVKAGQVIAQVGSTGSSTGPHLHFELRIDNISFDPQIGLDEAINAV